MERHERGADEPSLEHRSVEAHDPSLSQEANELLTQELREAVGRDAVDVPIGSPDPAHGRHRRHIALVRVMIENSVYVLSAFATVLTAAAVVSLVTGSWWILGAVVLLHLVATAAIAGVALLLAGEPEHVAPSTAALLEDEGVADPDRLFTELVDEFTRDARP
ncbi:MAG TPA: hypothetical protein VGM91_00795 [Conexibacter sp.]